MDDNKLIISKNYLRCENAWKTGKIAQLSVEFAENVKKLILVTKHIKTPTTTDEKYIVDIDIAIFGQLVDVFERYETGIRKEYYWITPLVYRRKRLEFLQQFIDRPYIYHNEFFYQKYETQVRKNLEWMILQLKS